MPLNLSPPLCTSHLVPISATAAARPWAWGHWAPGDRGLSQATQGGWSFSELLQCAGPQRVRGEGTPAPATWGMMRGRTRLIFRTVGDGEYIFCTKSMSGTILLAFSPCPLAALWPAPLGPTHVSGLEGAFSTPSSELGWRRAVCPPTRIHEGAVGSGPLSFFSVLSCLEANMWPMQAQGQET